MSDADRASTIKPFWKFRQPLSGLSHLSAAVLSVLGCVFLVRLAAEKSIWHVIAFSIFGGSMALLYFSSTLYHLLPLSEAGIQRLRKLDHSMIYVFMAGTYTPFCLLLFRHTWGLYFCVAVWSLACLGIVIKLFWLESNRWVRMAFYQSMAWLSLVVLPPIIRVFPARSVFWLMMGGAFYLVGSAVYALKKPDPFPKVFGFHEIWHLFVILGSACHFRVMAIQFL